MDPSGKYITDDGIINKKDYIGQTIIILSKIIITGLAVVGVLSLYSAAV